MFLLRTKVYWRFTSHIQIREQKHETCFNVFNANVSILEVYLTYLPILHFFIPPYAFYCHFV